MVEDSKLIRGCGVDLRDVESGFYGIDPDGYIPASGHYAKGWWNPAIRCGCSMFNERDRWPSEKRTEWILCFECAVKFGFRW